MVLGALEDVGCNGNGVTPCNVRWRAQQAGKRYGVVVCTVQPEQPELHETVIYKQRWGEDESTNHCLPLQ